MTYYRSPTQSRSQCRRAKALTTDYMCKRYLASNMSRNTTNLMCIRHTCRLGHVLHDSSSILTTFDFDEYMFNFFNWEFLFLLGKKPSIWHWEWGP